jgi:hypothetical protein
MSGEQWKGLEWIGLGKGERIKDVQSQDKKENA